MIITDESQNAKRIQKGLLKKVGLFLFIFSVKLSIL